MYTKFPRLSVCAGFFVYPASTKIPRLSVWPSYPILPYYCRVVLLRDGDLNFTFSCANDGVLVPVHYQLPCSRSRRISDLKVPIHREKKTSPDYKTLIPRPSDSLASIGHVHKELSFKRRDAIRPYLNQEFKQACLRTLKPGKFLFDQDLPKTLQELKTTNN